MTLNSSKHLKWMREALNVGRKALELKEVPVGCVIVYENERENKIEEIIIGHGHNLTNLSKNPTRHAEFEAIGILVFYWNFKQCPYRTASHFTFRSLVPFRGPFTKSLNNTFKIRSLVI